MWVVIRVCFGFSFDEGLGWGFQEGSVIVSHGFCRGSMQNLLY